jgi:sporulation protein YlmC with PRC-barrel domain
MNKHKTILTAFLLISLLVAACAPLPELSDAEMTSIALTDFPENGAEETLPADGTVDPAETEIPGELPSTGTLGDGRLSLQLDFEVLNENGEVIGTVADIVLDLEAQEIAYVAVVLDADGRLVAIPYSEIEVAGADMAGDSDTDTDYDEGEGAGDTDDADMEAENAFVVTADQQLLVDAPVFDLNSVPQVGESAEGWDAELAAYWSGEAAPQDDAEVTAVPTAAATEEDMDDEEDDMMTGELVGFALASELIGLTVNGTDDQAMSSFADVIVDTETGGIEYLVLTASAEANPEATLTPVPLNVFGWDSEAIAFVLTVEQNIFAAAPSFPGGQYPDLSQEGWDSEIADYWNQYSTSG